MFAVGNHRGARTISLALVAGFVAFQAALAIGAGAIEIPGLLLLRFAEESDRAQLTHKPEGGESVIAKVQPPAAVLEPPAEPASTPVGEPRLDGLADIPLQDWISDKPPVSEHETLAQAAKSGEVLPWDAAEPVPFDADRAKLAQADTAAGLPNLVIPDTQLTPVALPEFPAHGPVEGWVKAKVTEVKAEYRARPLYHFEFWLDAPDDVKRRLVAVAYNFNTPAVMPQSQVSGEKISGFRVSAGGLVCADKVTVTLKFNDGGTQQVDVDGCKLLG